MNFRDVRSMDFAGKNILIIGCPASGKTYLANALSLHLPAHTLIHTDDYMVHGYKDSLYVILDEIKNINNNTWKTSIVRRNYHGDNSHNSN
jgi:adenylate kinase family enzyme